ncbi:uncharacterized protein LOC142017899 [Carettochelys insculpta]|uniref:uncharacterized protein LOC142017899 n=1 Tax=Carettochelys insculpta TaxID=44489 RepID=UPI003EC005D4
MDEPHPGKTTFVIMVSPLPGKYELVPNSSHCPPHRKHSHLTGNNDSPNTHAPAPAPAASRHPHLPRRARRPIPRPWAPRTTALIRRSLPLPQGSARTEICIRPHAAPPRPSSSLRRRPPARRSRSSRAEGEPHGRARPGLPEESRAALEGGACGGPLARQAEEPRAPPAGPGAGPQLRGAPRAPAPAEQLPKAKAAPPGSGVTQNLSLNPSERSRCEPGVPSLGSQYRTWPAGVATRPRTDSSTQHTSPGPGSRKLTSTNWSSRKRTHVGTHLCRHQSANWPCKLSRPSACRQTGAGFQPGAVPDLGEEATQRTSGNLFSLPKLRLKGVAGGGGVWGGRKEGRKESVSLQRTEPCRTTCDPDHTHRVTPDMGPC